MRRNDIRNLPIDVRACRGGATTNRNLTRRWSDACGRKAASAAAVRRGNRTPGCKCHQVMVMIGVRPQQQMIECGLLIPR
jgi:hypothetical protein